MKRKVPVVHPWKEFDMIGGTSTVRILCDLLAIMLGRLRMSIDECEEVYVELPQKIFVLQCSKANIVGQGRDFVNARGKFSSEALQAGIKDVIKSKGFSEDELFYNQDDGECKVFVSVVRGEDGKNTVIRSYMNPEMPNPMRRYSSTFFDSIAIGPNHQTYVDGALGYNNPIRLLDRESKDLWPDSERIFVSIGTGTAPDASLDGNILTLTKHIQEIVVETQKTHEEFYKDHEKTIVANRQYFRFNVEGLKRIGLEKHKARPAIYTATDTYLAFGVPGTMIKQLVEVLKSGK
ncbi:FabD/lysophospholipase-like protein [Stipitochalara longipes BDJ]|nr:FabD/lysophospholipase-like protein [Stipitochalara longipes BDJ]